MNQPVFFVSTLVWARLDLALEKSSAQLVHLTLLSADSELTMSTAMFRKYWSRK